MLNVQEHSQQDVRWYILQYCWSADVIALVFLVLAT